MAEEVLKQWEGRRVAMATTSGQLVATLRHVGTDGIMVEVVEPQQREGTDEFYPWYQVLRVVAQN